MSLQMPWNKYEAVILLEGYLEVKKEQLPRYSIVKRISNDLRKMATNQGIEIDAVYRNENGISFQMTSMASAYEMTNKGKPATKLFSKIVDMYINDNVNYNKILEDAKQMILNSNSDIIEVEKTKNNSVLSLNNSLKVLKYDFSTFESLSFTQPISVKYLEETITGISSWRQLSIELLRLIKRTSNETFLLAVDKLYYSSNIPPIGRKSDYDKYRVVGNIDDEFYFEANRSANDLMQLIKRVIDACGINYDAIKIEYTKNDKSTPRNTKLNSNIESQFNQMNLEGENNSISDDIKDNCNLILLENFEEGYRIGNYMHQMRFLNLYNSCFNSQLDKQPSEIDDLLKSVGRLVDDRIFASDGNDANDIINEVIQCIKSTFDNGASSIFYNCLFEKFRDKLVSEMNIYSPDTLKSVLQSDNNLRIYSFNKTHIAKIGASNDIESEITKILRDSHVPISYDAIQRELWYIPYDSIRNAVGRIENAAYIGDSSFIYAPNFNISPDELSKLITAMHNAIYSKGYIVAKDLQELYINNCPFSAMDSGDYKDYAIREILSVLLKDKFHFSSSVISEIGTELTYGDIYENYAKERDMVTVNELRELSSELGVQIYWDSIMNQMIRISSSELINKRLFNFDIEAVDKHLESICDGDYVLLKDIRLYLSFPPLNYKWNGFILYSYLMLFSRKFSIIRYGFVYSDYYGAMVKKTSHLQSYEQIAADILSKDYSWDDEKSALKCIINAGLQKNNANKHIASIVKMAKQMRNNNK